jgi:hypothetical protein
MRGAVVAPNQLTGITHFGIEVGDLAGTVATLLKRGAAIDEPGRTPSRALFARMKDPEGTQIEVMELTPESLQVMPTCPATGAESTRHRTGRHPEILDRLVAEYRSWNETMQPLDPGSYTSGPTGVELADHYAVTAPKNIGHLAPGTTGR